MPSATIPLTVPAALSVGQWFYPDAAAGQTIDMGDGRLLWTPNPVGISYQQPGRYPVRVVETGETELVTVTGPMAARTIDHFVFQSREDILARGGWGCDHTPAFYEDYDGRLVTVIGEVKDRFRGGAVKFRADGRIPGPPEPMWIEGCPPSQAYFYTGPIIQIPTDPNVLLSLCLSGDTDTDPRGGAAHLARSDDRGRTWRYVGLLYRQPARPEVVKSAWEKFAGYNNYGTSWCLAPDGDTVYAYAAEAQDAGPPAFNPCMVARASLKALLAWDGRTTSPFKKRLYNKFSSPGVGGLAQIATRVGGSSANHVAYQHFGVGDPRNRFIMLAQTFDSSGDIWLTYSYDGYTWNNPASLVFRIGWFTPRWLMGGLTVAAPNGRIGAGVDLLYVAWNQPEREEDSRQEVHGVRLEFDWYRGALPTPSVVRKHKQRELLQPNQN